RAGQPDIAIEHAEASLRLSPRARVGVSVFVIGAAHFVSRRFDEAVPKLRLAIEFDNSAGVTWLITEGPPSHRPQRRLAPLAPELRNQRLRSFSDCTRRRCSPIHASASASVTNGLTVVG